MAWKYPFELRKRQPSTILPRRISERAVPLVGKKGNATKCALGLDGYLSAFWYFLVLGEGLGLFDLLVIDLLWWRNTERIRFSFLPQKEPYQDLGKRGGSFARGIPLFVVVAALTAGVVTLL